MLRNFFRLAQKPFIQNQSLCGLPKNMRLFSETENPETPEITKNDKRKTSQNFDFEQWDHDYLKEQTRRQIMTKQYLKAVDYWKKPLEKKRRRKQRIEQIKAEFVRFGLIRWLLSPKTPNLSFIILTYQ